MSVVSQLHGAVEVILYRVKARRSDLFKHNPRVLELAATALDAMQRVIDGHAASVRCDRSKRYRLFQFDGSRGFQLEDVIAVGEETERGQAAAVAAFGVVLRSWGFQITPVTEQPKDSMSAVGALIKEGGELLAAAGSAMGDGNVNASDLAQIVEGLPDVKRAIAIVEAAHAAANEGTQR